jgi:hypothetical protein
MPPPTVPDTISVPEYFSPSALIHMDECRLRTMTAQLGRECNLPRGPAAERGVLFHRLLEDASRGRIPRSGSVKDDVGRALDVLVASARGRLEQDPTTASFSDLSSTLSPLEWRNTCGRMVDAAARLWEVPRFPGSVRTETKPVSQEIDLRHVGRMSEVPIRAPKLRIAGRVDVLERTSQNQVTILDYKTGAVSDENGSVLPHIALQLRLYGLAVQELLRDVAVRLVVVADTEHEIAFTPAEAVVTRKWLERVLDPLIPGSTVSPDTVASPGSACRYCPIRQACDRYRRVVPEFWRDGVSGFSLPFDTWGEIEETQVDLHGNLTVRLRDAAGRLVRVSRLAPHPQLGTPGQGDYLWCFGLEATPPPSVGGISHHPRNFHEIPGGPLQRRAWSAMLYVGGLTREPG